MMSPYFFEMLKSALEDYDKRKGFWRRWFGDQVCIKKLRSLSPKDQENLFKVCECFFKNTPKPSQASYQVYKKLADLDKFSNTCLEKFKQKIPSPEQQINLESKIIQELISNNTISLEKALSLNPVQRENLESEAIQKLVLEKKIDFNQALSLQSIQCENLEFKSEKSTVNDVLTQKEVNNKLEEKKIFNQSEKSKEMLKTNLINDKKIPIDENFKRKLSFLADLENDRPPFLSLNQMHHLIKEKKLRRKEDLNIFVFPISEYNQLELKIFLVFWKKILTKLQRASN